VFKNLTITRTFGELNNIFLGRYW